MTTIYEANPINVSIHNKQRDRTPGGELTTRFVLTTVKNDESPKIHDYTSDQKIVKKWLAKNDR